MSGTALDTASVVTVGSGAIMIGMEIEIGEKKTQKKNKGDTLAVHDAGL